MTSTAGFTKGPWRAELARWTPDAPVAGFSIHSGERKRQICGNNTTDAGNGVEPFMSPDELEANARLIAAAPLMHAACEAAIAYDAAIASCGNDPSKMATFHTATGDDLDALYADWIEKSRAALSKAVKP